MKAKKPPATGNAEPPAAPSPTPQLDALLQAEPDLADRIFDYVVELVPEIRLRQAEIKTAIREEFAGERIYVAKRVPGERERVALQVLALFNGRNATEVARRLQIHRATVYRMLKQPGRA